MSSLPEVLDGAASNYSALLDIAAKINAEMVSVELHARSAVESALRLGQHLTLAREQVARGNWEAWLAIHCPSVALRTARAYLSFAARYAVLSDDDRQRVAGLPLRLALRAIATGAEIPGRRSPSSTESVRASKHREADILRSSCRTISHAATTLARVNTLDLDARTQLRAALLAAIGLLDELEAGWSE